LETGGEIAPGGGLSRLSVMTTVSGHILRAAVTHALEAQQIERQFTSSENEEIPERHTSAVLPSVILAATLIEAGINETFLAATTPDPHIFPSVSPQTAEQLAGLWVLLQKPSGEQRKAKLKRPGKTPEGLWKANLLLMRLGRIEFATTDAPYSAAKGLLWFRNALVHYKPEWDTDLDLDEGHGQLAVELQGRFAENPFTSQNRAFFPLRALSADAATWACTTAAEFLKELIKRLGIESPLSIHIERGLRRLTGLNEIEEAGDGP
jgi:hypothetical protein